MTALSRAQIESVAENAGFRGQDLPTAVAIAFAESSGKADQYNAEAQFFEERNERNVSPSARDGLGSRGLWQIFRFEHPEFDGWNLEDPQVNACAAYLVYARAGKRFTPWSTYRNGNYRRFLPVEGAAT